MIFKGENKMYMNIFIKAIILNWVTIIFRSNILDTTTAVQNPNTQDNADAIYTSDEQPSSLVPKPDSSSVINIKQSMYNIALFKFK